MGKIALVFSGQGAQYSGMGKSLYESSESAKKLYDAAEAIRPGTIAQSFEGTDEELKMTENTQPCLYLVDLAAALALGDAGIHADAAAGFSLGEIAALAYAGAYSVEEGFRIVTERGRLMGSVTPEAPTAMCAVVKLDSVTISSAASKYNRLYAVNFNCPGQTVVSGLKSSMDEFSKEISALGGRCIPLATSGAFHSPFMSEAAGKFGEFLGKCSIGETKIPVYSNTTAVPYSGKTVDTLSRQMCSPVKWEDTINNMLADGFDCFIEVGAGKTLCGLIKKITKSAQVFSVENAETLAETIKAVKGCA